MTTEERFSQSLDLYYSRKEREKFLCCKLSMSKQALSLGDEWSSTAEFRCESCGLLWRRHAPPDSAQWNLIVA